MPKYKKIVINLPKNGFAMFFGGIFTKSVEITKKYELSASFSPKDQKEDGDIFAKIRIEEANGD